MTPRERTYFKDKKAVRANINELRRLVLEKGHENCTRAIIHALSVPRGEHGCYILEGKLPKPVDFMEYAAWRGDPGRETVKKTALVVGDTIVEVSTVFLGVGIYTPYFFETMIFGGEFNYFQCRYETWEEAERGHEKAVELAKSNKKRENE